MHPLVGSILIKGVPDISAFTSGLQTGAISGRVLLRASSTLNQLEQNNRTSRSYQGPGWLDRRVDRVEPKGVLGDVRVRQALSLALDRTGIINSVYKGAALLPKWISNPGAFGYGKSVFNAAYNAAPTLKHDIAAAKKLVQTGRRDRQDVHHRYVQPAGRHLGRCRRLPGRSRRRSG